MSRPWHIWAVFAACLAVVFAALVWLTVLVLRLDHAGAEAWRRAAAESNTRTALWRMDSALAPLIARESARPYFAYASFYPVQRAYTRMFSNLDFGEVVMASPLLSQVSPYIRLHFQVGPDGEWTSPQVPHGPLRDLATPQYVTPEAIQLASEQLAQLSAKLQPRALSMALPLETEKLTELVFAPPQERQAQSGARQQRAAPQGLQQMEEQQVALNFMENAARVRSMQSAQQPNSNVWNGVDWSDDDVMEGPLTPLWHNQMLLLARRVVIDGTQYVQGCRLDWPMIQAWLGAEVADLYPNARLEPVHDDELDGSDGVLAALPVRLVPGPLAVELDPVQSPIRLILALTWGGVLVAAVAVVVLLLGTVSLSERRAAFVSAVTHELRTPLTTFRLYTDLLADDMVKDESKRRDYLRTLHAEASRLGHLVENVLAYARLERGRAGARVEKIALNGLLDKVTERLADRAAQAGLTLQVESLSDDLRMVAVKAAPASVEQVLFNLVDNACKYAIDGEPKEVCLTASRNGQAVTLSVRDHGPGVPESEVGRLFKPFHKSARDAASSAPGVGLGLALSRRLARDMGGDLRLGRQPDAGACFELVLTTA